MELSIRQLLGGCRFELGWRLVTEESDIFAAIIYGWTLSRFYLRADVGLPLWRAGNFLRGIPATLSRTWRPLWLRNRKGSADPRK